MPVNRYDANNFLSDIQQNGVILSGQNSVFNVGTTPRRGAALLQISDAAGTYNFTGNNSATLSALGRQLTINQVSPIAGLHVSRKVFVPGSGYFTRYLEILENPGTTDVTVNVQIGTRYANSGIIATSSGDTNLDTVTTPDYWVTMDDGADADPFMSSSLPATAHVFGASGASHLADVLDYRVEGDGVKTLGYRFNAITVPAGAKVVLMHFVVEQINRAGAKAAAERLVQLPPEALEALTPDEIAAITNMPLPADGQSVVAPLAALTGSISGRVLEGDNATVVSGAYVRVRSSHPLFNRTWQYSGYYSTTCGQYNVSSLISAANGSYSLVGRIIEGSSVPVPVDADLLIQVVPDGCYEATRGHPMTGVQSPLYTPRFAAGTSTLTQDIVFPTGILTGTVVGAADFGVTSGTLSLPAANGVRAGYVFVRSDGSYTYPGLAGGTYTLNASVPHPQGSGLIGSRADAVATVGQVTVTDVILQATGAINGTVITANGEASANSTVRITSGNFYRQTASDSLGRYALTAVPVGTYSLTVRDGHSGATTNAVSVSVSQNQTATQNVSLLALGSVQLQVNFARGAGAFDAPVYLQAAALGGGEILAGRADLSGRVTIANIPVGSFSLRARHPAVTALSKVLTGSISANGEVQQGTLVLQPVANIALTVLNQDASNAPAVGASVALTDTVNGYRVVGTTSSTGLLNIPNIPEGSYTISVNNATSGATGGISGSIGIADDGQSLTRTVSITADRSVLGVIAYTSERDIYSFAANAGDVISVRINGRLVDVSPSLYLTRAQIFNPSRNLVASGYGYDARNSNLQYNESGNLTNTVASVAGNYSVAVRSYYTSSGAGYETGGYRLSVSVNNTPVALGAYADGGSVTGHLYRAGGTTPLAGQRLNLSTNSNPVLNANVVTDAAGAYTFSGVPFGNSTLAAIDSDQRRPISVGVQVTNSTPRIVDLIMPAKNTLNISVVDGSGVATGSNTRVDVTDTAGTRNLYTSATGNIVTTVYGNNITVRAYNPQNNLPTTLTVTPTADNETLSVNVALAATGTLTGQVTSGETLVPNAQISVSFYISGYGYSNRYAVTNASGVYTLSYLPVGTVLNISTYHPNNYAIRANATAQLSSNNETQTLNLTLAAIGSINGRVTYSTGNPVPNAQVNVNYNVPGYGYSNSYAVTDANGAYTVSYLPVGTVLNISTYHPQNSSITTNATAQLSTSNETQMVNLTLATTGSISGRVTYASGSPAANTYLYATNTATGAQVSTYTNATGDYQFSVIEVGVQMVIRVQNPNTYVQVSRSAMLTTAGQALAGQDLAFEPVGSITGRVLNASGTPLANQYVSATYIYDAQNGYTTYRSVYTNATGVFRIDNLPAGQAISILAFHPTVSNLQTRATATLTSDGQVLTIDLIHAGSGSITGQVVNTAGETIANSYVTATYVYDTLNHYTNSYATYTDANGQYRFNNLPLAQAIALRAYLPSFSQYTDASETLTTDGQVLVASPIVLPVVGNLRVSIVDAEGVTPAGYVYIYVRDSASGNESYRGYIRGGNSFVLVSNVPLGPYTVRAVNSNGGAELASATGTITSGAEVPVNLVTSLIKGVVQFADGTVVTNLGAFVTQIAPDGSIQTRYSNSTGVDGSYRILGATVGAFTLTAQDTNSGLQAVVNGNLASVSLAETVNVTLQASGTVTGTVRDSAGNVVPHTSLALNSTGLAFTRWASSDSLGQYSFDHVALGDITVYSRNSNGYNSSANGNLASMNSTVSIDVIFPATGSITGTVFASDGITPVVNARVTVESLLPSGPFSPYRSFVTADSLGGFVVNNFPVGNVSVSATDPSNSQVAGLASGAVSATATNTINITLGNAARFNFNLDGSDGYRYDVMCDGALSDGGTVSRNQNDAYDGTYYLAVNGQSFPCINVALLENGSRQLVFGSRVVSGLDVTRKVFAPATGGYARYLELLHNPGSAEITVPVEISGNLGSDDDTRIVVTPAASNMHYAVTDQSGYCCDPALGHVFASAGAGVAVANVQFSNGNDEIVYRWNVTIPAGGTVALMHFGIQRSITDTAAVRVQAEALVNGTDPHMFDGMSSAEKSAVRNFAIAPTGSITGQVVNTAGDAVANSRVTATYEYDTLNHYTTYYTAYTDATGQYRFNNLPLAQAIALRAHLPDSTNQYTDASETLTTDGQVLVASPIVLPAVGSLRVSVVDAEGVTPANVYIYVRDSASAGERYRGYISGAGNPSLLVTNMPAGSYIVRAVDGNSWIELASATGNITTGAEVPVNLVTSLVKGVVRFADGTVVSNPGAFATQIAADGNIQTRYSNSTNADGSYRILGVTVGEYTLTVQDPNSGLQAVVSGNLVSLTSAETVDVTLPTSGTVTGTVRDTAGNIVPNASMALSSSGLAFTRGGVYSDTLGQFSFNNVALGDVTVYSQDGNGYISSANGNLATVDSTATIDIAFPATGSVTGTVFASDGTTPVVNAHVTVESLLPSGPFSPYKSSVTADSLGVFVVNNFPVGNVSVSATDPSNFQVGGLASGAVSATTTNNINVTLGDAARFDFNLDGSDGYRYDVRCDGSLSDGGTVSYSENDAYDWTYYLAVNGQSFPCISIALLENGSRQLILGPRVVAGLDVTRKVFVPITGGYSRYLELLHNPGSAEITVPVEISGNLGSDSDTRIVVTPAATDKHYAVTDQTGYCCDPALGHVFASVGARVAVANTKFINNNDNIMYRWNVTVPAGGTVALMHFGIQRSITDTAAVQTQAEALVNGTDPYMFDGLSSAEKSEVLNFAIP